MQALGKHLILDLLECKEQFLNNVEEIRRILLEAAKKAHATIVDVVFHEFNPHGVSGVIVIAESHITIHTWPEYRYAAVDIFGCGDTLQMEVAKDYLVKELDAKRISVTELPRGVLVEPLLISPKTDTLPLSCEDIDC